MQSTADFESASYTNFDTPAKPFSITHNLRDTTELSFFDGMNLNDFHYHLPDKLIASWPAPERTASRLLAVKPDGGLDDLQFEDISTLVSSGDLLVLNDTRVIKARLRGAKPTGGAVEILVERVLSSTRAVAHVKANKTPRVGAVIHLKRGFEVTVTGRREGLFELELNGPDWFDCMVDIGEVPLPPYLGRDVDASDTERYQTVFAKRDGAVAAPTAGLHFDDTLLEALRAQGVNTAFITLHVGAGTFQTIRDHDVANHVMHAEWLDVNDGTCDVIETTRKNGGRVIAVGTTVVRALESAARGGTLKSYRGDTQLFIKPGFDFHVVDAMVTNFHLPATTLMMLVAAFAGHTRILNAYNHAVREKYRFFSYGDAMFLHRAENE